MIFLTIKIVLAVLAAAVIANIIFAIKTKNPFRVILWSGGLGVASLIILSITQYFFEIGIRFNLFTLVSSFLFGIPGVITMLITNVIWNI